MLTFVGLGLYDERSVTIRGRDAIREADRIVAEFYTSQLAGTSIAELESFHDVSIEVRDRAGIEQDPEPVLTHAESHTVVFLTAGDPMVSTTHVDLRLRAEDRGIETRIVHAPSAATAAAGLTGLQNYRFGAATTLPFPRAHGGGDVPQSVLETITSNRERGLHTLVYLDIKAAEDDYMTANTAAGLLEDAGVAGPGIAVCQAGSDSPEVVGDRLARLRQHEFGPPLHLLVLPGALHPMEVEALETFAGMPEPVLPDESH